MTINILIRQAGEEWSYCGHRGTVAEAEALAQEWRAAGYEAQLLQEGEAMTKQEAITQVNSYIEMLRVAVERGDWTQVGDVGFALGHLGDEAAKVS